MKSQLLISIKMFSVMTVITGVIYPVSVWAIGQLFFNDKANGSLIIENNKIIGSKLIGQNFSQDKYFHGRPSAVNYGITSEEDYQKGNYIYTSGGSNLGPTSKRLKENIENNVKILKSKNSQGGKIPFELVTSSASGLDPDISLKSALFQAPRISKARNISKDEINKIIEKNIQKPFLGFNGEERINVLQLNLDLDKTSK